MKTIISKFLLKFFKISKAYGRILIPASITSPVGKVMGNLTSYGGVRVSLQWIKVSSRSKITLFLPKYGLLYPQLLHDVGELLFSFSFIHLWQKLNFQGFLVYVNWLVSVIFLEIYHLCNFWWFKRCSRCRGVENKDYFQRYEVLYVRELE